MLEVLLRQDGSWTALRDLALLRVGIDSMLRSSDIVKLCVRDICHDGEVVAEFAVKQRPNLRDHDKAASAHREIVVRTPEARRRALFDAFDPANEASASLR